jgi:hypothetical protein
LHNDQAKDVAATAILKGPKGAKQARTGGEFVAYIESQIRKGDAPFADSLTDMFRTADSVGATEGLKAAVAEAAINSIYTQGGKGVETVSLAAPDRVKKIVTALEATGKYTQQQMESFEQVADAAYRQASANKVKIFKGQSNTAQDTMRATVLENMLSYGMLKVAGATKPSGPGALKWAQSMSALGTRIGKKITQSTSREVVNDAIFNPELMAALMENPNTLSEAGRSKIRRAVMAITKYTVGGTAQPSQAQIYSEILEDDDGQ